MKAGELFGKCQKDVRGCSIDIFLLFCRLCCPSFAFFLYFTVSLNPSVTKIHFCSSNLSLLLFTFYPVSLLWPSYLQVCPCCCPCFNHQSKSLWSRDLLFFFYFLFQQFIALFGADSRGTYLNKYNWKIKVLEMHCQNVYILWCYECLWKSMT